MFSEIAPRTLFEVVKVASEDVDGIENADRPVGGHLGFRVRTLSSVLLSATSELGELAEEVRINDGHSYKKPGEDGIVGEAIDTIACLLDLIHKYDPMITERELIDIAKIKCAKWVRKVGEQKVLNDGVTERLR